MGKPFVRLALMIAAFDFVGDYVFAAAWENLSVSDWTEYDGIYAAPILRDILMFAGI